MGESTEDDYPNARPSIRSYFGVAPDELAALGAVSVGAGRVESCIRAIAADLGINPGKSRTSDLIKSVRRIAAADGLPAHARVSGQTLAVWCEEAGPLLARRDELVHSVAAHTVREGEKALLLQHLRSGARMESGATAIWDVADALAVFWTRGQDLLVALRHNPRLGVFLPNTVLDDAWIPICNTDIGGADMARPTDAEMDEWWARFGPIPRI